MAEQPVAVSARAAKVPYPQRPLSAQPADVAVVFIGGFGDEISGVVEYMARCLPPVSAKETRAYYHWNGGEIADATRAYPYIASAIQAFRQQNPHADVVLIGHSMGAATALKVAELLPPPAENEGRVLLVTIDPADRVVQPIRPASVFWWGNCYVVNSQSGHDFIAELGGRWNHCGQADANIKFNGLRRDEYGHAFIHDNAFSLIMSRRGNVPQALYDMLRLHLSSDK